MAEDKVLDVEPGDLHLGQFELDELAVADALTPQHAVPGVGHRQLQALLDEAERHRRHPGSLGDEVALGRVAPASLLLVLRLTQKVVFAHPDVGQEELAGGGGVESHLAEGLGLIESGHAPVEDEGQDLAVADGCVRAVIELGVEDDGVGIGTVGDERLVAVQDVLVAVPSGRRLHAAQRVRSRVGLGDGPGPHLVHGEQIETPPLHLRRRPLLHDGAGRQSDTDAHGGHDPWAVVAQFHDGDEGHRRRAAVALAFRSLHR